MSDRFYYQQLNATGTCPGANTTKRRKRVAWTEEEKQEVIEAYEAANPTPETSTEIVKQIALERNQSPNGVRVILSKAGVYVKQTPAASGSGNKGGSTGGTRVSKADAQQKLTDALTDAGVEVDEDIVSKLTGKAALYFASALAQIAS